MKIHDELHETCNAQGPIAGYRCTLPKGHTCDHMHVTPYGDHTRTWPRDADELTDHELAEFFGSIQQKPKPGMFPSWPVACGCFVVALALLAAIALLVRRIT